MAVIKSVDIISWAKIHALFGIVVGLIYGIIIAFMAIAFGIKQDDPMLQALGIMAIVILPIVCAIIWFIMGAIVAFLYNIFASKFGGIQVELGN
jgi:uncharacterized protein with PQ loop repeat